MLVSNELSWKGKMFVLFVALILRREMRRLLSKWSKKNRSSLETVFIMLKDIQCRKHKDKWILIKAFTKYQKEIIQDLNLNVDILQL